MLSFCLCLSNGQMLGSQQKPQTHSTISSQYREISSAPLLSCVLTLHHDILSTSMWGHVHNYPRTCAHTAHRLQTCSVCHSGIKCFLFMEYWLGSQARKTTKQDATTAKHLRLTGDKSCRIQPVSQSCAGVNLNTQKAEEREITLCLGLQMSPIRENPKQRTKKAIAYYYLCCVK